MVNMVKRQRRFRVSLPLWIRIQRRLREKRPTPKPIFNEETTTENISSTGCYFLLSGKPPVGSIAEMEITFPHIYRGGRGGTLYCRGKVVRVEDKAAEGKAGVACKLESYKFES